MAADLSIPAVFMRGGTSKGLFFHARDLPANRQLREKLFLRALGSPDPEGRQLDGMGGGISSLSKVVIVNASSQAGVQLDYEFGQVVVREPVVDFSGNCGNLTAAIGQFAASQDLVAADWQSLRLFNLNTQKQIKLDTAPAAPGGMSLARPVIVTFLNVGGESTGRMFPLGERLIRLPLGSISVAATVIDAGAPVIIVAAAELESAGYGPERLADGQAAIADFEALRQYVGKSIGMSAADGSVPPSNPTIAIVGPAREFKSLGGQVHCAGSHDLMVRFIVMGLFHRAVPLTGAIALAVASRISGTLAALDCGMSGSGTIRVAHPSGVLAVAISGEQGMPDVSITRTARCLMSGRVHI